MHYNYERITDPEEEAFDAPFYSVVESVEALDAHTIKFTLKHPSVTLLPVMPANRAGFLPVAALSCWACGSELLSALTAGPRRYSRRRRVIPYLGCK